MLFERKSDSSQRLYPLCDTPLTLVRLEEVVAGRQLERHARCAPDVGGRAVARAYQHFESAGNEVDFFRVPTIEHQRINP